MKKILVRIIWFILMSSLITATAWADCIYNGQYYPTGTKIGNLTCQTDGTWK